MKTPCSTQIYHFLLIKKKKKKNTHASNNAFLNYQISVICLSNNSL